MYLKTPYKVLTIDEIKNNEKEKNDYKDYSPIKLFQAENNLDIHTEYRKKEEQNKNSIDVS